MYQGLSVILLLDEGRDIMHPMFVKLFIETDPDELLAEEDRRRRARPSRRARAVRPTARDRQHKADRRHAGVTRW
jgi:hypothetical protein